MKRSRALLATSIVAVAATATSADAATLGIQNGPSVSVPDVQVPQLSPSLPKVQVRAPDVQVPTSPGGTGRTVQRLGQTVTGGGGGAVGGGGYAGSGASSSGAYDSSSTAGDSGSSTSGSSGVGGSGAAAARSRSASERSLTPRQRRIRAARERRALHRGVRRYQGCLGVVSSFEREVLIRRSGISGKAQSRAQVARALKTSQGRVHRGERSGLRGLRDAAASTGCEGGSAGGSSIVTFGNTSSQQIASATVAVATNSAPELRPVTAVAGESDRQVASPDTAAAGQLLGASVSSSGNDELTEGDGPTVAAAKTGSPTVDGPPTALFLLLLLLLLPLAFLFVRRRSAAVFATSSDTPDGGPPRVEEPGASEAAGAPVWRGGAPAESRDAESGAPLWDGGGTTSEPEGPSWAEAESTETVPAAPTQPAPRESGPAPEPAQEPDPLTPAAQPQRQVAKATPAVAPPARQGRRRQGAAVASGLASLVLGSLVSRRRRGRRRR